MMWSVSLLQRTMVNRINNYLKWLESIIFSNESKNYSKLVSYLFNQDFYWSIPMDENRYFDGMELRTLFEEETGGYIDILSDCSVLEVLIALAIRMEDIMNDDDYGDRTAFWFWEMIRNLGLSYMTNENYDEIYISNVLERFLNREYSSNGIGGLFYIENCNKDLRDVEIWYQMYWYLDYILDVKGE